MIDGCSAATVSVLAHGTPRTTAVSDPVAVEVDVAQYVVGEGPCLQAARIADRVRFELLDPGGRFAPFAPLAARAGIREVLSLPVVVGDTTVATLNLYSTDRLGAGAEPAALVLAAQTAIAVTKPGLTDALRNLARSVQNRVDIQRTINVARGVLAGLRGCSIEQADRLLDDASEVNRADLAETARRVLAAVERPGPA